jgi:MFS family permease
MDTQTKIELPFLTLLLMISFASVNAVLFTPALPDIAQFFGVSSDSAQQTISLFLVGYTLGQLAYGPVANRFGSKPALYVGISIQIFSSLLCVLAGMLQEYSLLLIGRFLLALGSGVGLNMAITLVSASYDPRTAAQKVSYLLLAFAITPGIGSALGGVLNTNYGWMSCFYACAIYGLLLLFLVSRLPETLKTPDLNALKIKNLLQGYGTQFKNIRLIASGLLIGCLTCFVYVFAATAPFIAIKALPICCPLSVYS